MDVVILEEPYMTVTIPKEKINNPKDIEEFVAIYKCGLLLRLTSDCDHYLSIGNSGLIHF